MNETLTASDAARILAETSRYEDNLVQRTEGLTAIIWGLVTPAIWLTYGFADTLGGLVMPWAALLWIPWVAAGALASTALWRSAALSQPGLDDGGHLSRWLRWLGLVAVISVAFAFVRPTDAASPLLVVGAVWFCMGAFNVWQMSRRGRWLWGICGGVLVVTGAALMLASAPADVAGMTAILVTGLVPFAAGMWQTLQG